MIARPLRECKPRQRWSRVDSIAFIFERSRGRSCEERHTSAAYFSSEFRCGDMKLRGVLRERSLELTSVLLPNQSHVEDRSSFAGKACGRHHGAIGLKTKSSRGRTIFRETHTVFSTRCLLNNTDGKKVIALETQVLWVLKDPGTG